MRNEQPGYQQIANEMLIYKKINYHWITDIRTIPSLVVLKKLAISTVKCYFCLLNWLVILFVAEVGYGKLALLYSPAGSVTFGEGNLTRYAKTVIGECFLTQQLNF